MGVNSVIANNVELLASRFSTDPLDTGDNTVALAMLDVHGGKFLSGDTATINDFYESSIVQIGVDTRANLESLAFERTFVNSFERRRQEVSGVSLDEEVTLMI